MINKYRPEGMTIGTLHNREILAMGRAGLEKAMANGDILEAIVTMCDAEMDLHVDLNGIEGIIPRSEVCYSLCGDETKDIAIITRVGKPVCFKVISVIEDDGRVQAYLSRRQAQMDCMNNYIFDLIPGDILSARVTHMEQFGAFVDIGCGIVSLLSVDCISVSRFSHPKDRLYNGMTIYTVLKSINKENGRIFVSMRELLGTWAENAAMFSQGQTVAGVIRSVENYGIFVELAPNLAGLAELKEDADVYRDACGKAAAVYIKSIIPDRMKIKLVLIDTYERASECKQIKYFVDCAANSHIDFWRYSPKESLKTIETVF